MRYQTRQPWPQEILRTLAFTLAAMIIAIVWSPPGYADITYVHDADEALPDDCEIACQRAASICRLAREHLYQSQSKTPMVVTRPQKGGRHVLL